MLGEERVLITAAPPGATTFDKGYKVLFTHGSAMNSPIPMSWLSE